MVQVDYVRVLLAAISNMVIGFLWFGPVFGKPWMKLMNFSKEKMTASQNDMTKLYGLQFVGAVVMAYVMAHVFVFASTYMDVSGPLAGVSVGFWNWLGFVAPVTLGVVLWEGKPWKLWILNNGYYLTSLIAMGIVFSL